MTRNVYHFEIMEGTDFTQSFLYTDPSTGLPIDVTSYTAELKGKQNMNGTYDGYSIPEYVFMLTSDMGGGINLTPNGIITVYITAAQTTQLNWNRLVYNLVLTDTSGRKIPFINGFLTVIPNADA